MRGETTKHTARARANSGRLLVRLGIFTTIVVGLLLRLDGINSSLWLDEFGTLWAVEGSLRDTWERALSFHGQSPFYYAIVWGFLQAFGESELSLRSSSLLFGLALWVAMYVGTRDFSGRRAAAFSVVLVAFCPFLVTASAEARPYGLGLFSLTLAVIGFLKAGMNGSRPGRMLWVIGGATTAWAHYLLFPVVIGLIGAYLIIPTIRKNYRPRAFIKDLVAQAVLVSLILPHLLTLLLRQESLSWLDQPEHSGVFILLLPLVPAIGFGEVSGASRDQTTSGLRLALYFSILFNVLLLLGLNQLGINLVFWRYAQGILVPAVLLASAGLALIRPERVVGALLWAGMFFGTGLWIMKESTGSVTGLSREDWRHAVAVLEEEIGRDRSALVLFRSGFVEEERQLLGFSIPATLAPLRSPGREVPDWDIVPLSYWWDTAERSAYFDSVVSLRLEDRNEFYFLGLDGGYMAALIEWVNGAWPGVFAHSQQHFGGVGLIHFRRMSKAEIGRSRS